MLYNGYGGENMDCKRIDAILESVAKSHCTTIDEVRKEILIVMEEAQQSLDPLVQARWAMIPHAEK